ncbi:MAG: ComF family protein [Candidatus Roizmanbacteria bacterium]|nr:ComF family protein [Candidatus Roizmanbacteria bacterium]
MVTGLMFLTDFLFPKFCLGCGYIGVYLCVSCQNKLKPIEQDVCLYCRKPSLFGLTHPGCQKKLNIDGLLALYYYSPILKKIIKNIKYRLATEVWQEFYRIIKPETIAKLGFYKKLSSDFIIQPIPLSKNKYNERGFNQAKIISLFFQKFINYPIVNLLVRKKGVLPQAQLGSLRKRYQNVRGSFQVVDKKLLNNKRVILVDDIVTTGSTVKEAAKILKEAGAKRVYILALAKG